MNGSSTFAIGISLWRTWALTVTHEASEYTAQKFNAEKTGGDRVTPSPNLDTDLVMACNQLVDCLIQAYKNPIQMNINIARYSKLISRRNTGHNEEKEKKLLKKCPPSHEGTSRNTEGKLGSHQFAVSESEKKCEGQWELANQSGVVQTQLGRCWLTC
ncbi:uncharacterized protein EDB93DRAFT_1107962 [Suillus bovinus]|uniref:uncharacterized protein n=1 Tax=Suillus bovinus TaxID=48563 RepID=UPI001B86E128|nr:uncharacterized protein EDB93DRAFT_1107962 [Suillus bovinus]KAG2132127.1 hypothetical protein EDB93DRAFT_1107962 [Suillus bovinus]